MNIHYAKQFKEPLKAGTKKHTIRHYRIEKGTELKHVVYPYTRGKREVVLENKCVSNQRIFITVDNGLEITVDCKYLNNGEVERLALNDGFNSAAEMELYFEKAIKKSGEDCLSGELIHWTSLKY